MARLRLFHDTDVARISTLEPRVPPIDAKPAKGLTCRNGAAGEEDVRPAVWLGTAANDATPLGSPPKPYRYVVEVEDTDDNLLAYEWVPGWYRYLSPMRVADFLVLQGSRYVSISSLRRAYDVDAQTLETEHSVYRASVTAALDEGDVARKEQLHQVAVAQKEAVGKAAERENASYVALMEALLAAPR